MLLDRLSVYAHKNRLWVIDTIIVYLMSEGRWIEKKKAGIELFGLVVESNSRSSYQRCSIKKEFLKLLQNSQENTCVRVSFLMKLQASGQQLHSKRDTGSSVFLWILQMFYEANWFCRIVFKILCTPNLGKQ